MNNNLFQKMMVKVMLFLLLVFSFSPIQLNAEVEIQPDDVIESDESTGEVVDGEDETREQTNTEEESQLGSETNEDEETGDTEKAEKTEKIEKSSEADETEAVQDQKESADLEEETDESEQEVELIEEDDTSKESEEEADEFNVTIMHMNDTHAHLDTMPKMYSAIKEVRANKENNLLLHGGDVFSGTLYFNEFKGQADLALMNLMGFDAMVYGNHEFDLGFNEGGQESLSKFVQGANFPLLGTNIDFSGDKFMAGLVAGNTLVENAPGGKSYHSIVKNIDGEKVGIFGLTTEDTIDIASPMNVKFNNYMETAKEAVTLFEEAGINKIIAVTHLGYDSNPAVGNDLLLGKVDGIDVIVGGHSHTALPEPTVVTADANGNEKDPTVIVQAGQYAENLGTLDVTFDENGVITEHAGKLIEVENYEEDSEANGVLKKYKDQIDSVMNEPSGAEALKDLPNPRLGEDSDDSVRANETELGNLVTDAMLAKAKEKFPETVIALQNGGGIRAPIDKGPITVGEIIAVLPFGNDPVVATITGAELKEILEHSVRLAPKENGGFLHVSGMRFLYDSSEDPGNRVMKMEVKQDDGNFVEIELDEEYMITTNQFTAQGGDGFETFAKIYAEGRVTNIGEIDWEQLRNYMVEEDYLNGKVDPVREGRIIDITRDEVPGDLEDPNGEEPKDPGEDPDKPGKEPKDPSEDTDKPGKEPKDPGEDPKKSGKDLEDPGDDSNGKPGDDGTVDKNDDKKGKTLPTTATTIYTTLLIGALLLLIGTIIYILKRRQAN
ncbi:bifunctional metallophosphatase/5'-nucleotidase [Pseudogracilibacillus sp. SO30301A]|uniref:bifunctional metallophosphatase/5'-nucleotidase n=1 Tax=Pseudogracilibacillus sp. SO30301A TaxID=3098291 RepID=UPI00300DEB98